MKRPDWRSAAAYDPLRALSPADLAWEFLRRNREYRQDYRRFLRSLSREEAKALGDKWGLRFPR